MRFFGLHIFLFRYYVGGVGKETTHPPRVAVSMWNKHHETVNRLPRTNNTCEGNYIFQQLNF